MKKTAVWCLLFMAFFAFPKRTCAAISFYFAKSDGSGFIIYSRTPQTTPDITYQGAIPGGMNANIIGFTFVKYFKCCVNYEFGLMYPEPSGGNPMSFANADIEFGVPVINAKNGLIYAVAGGFFYKQRTNYIPADSNLRINLKYNINGGMLGFDLVDIVTDRICLEAVMLHSYLGGSFEFETYGVADMPLSITMQRFTTRIILGDNLSLTVNYRLLRFNVRDLNDIYEGAFYDISTKLSATSMGLAYKF
ncbi:MAG: hypothetical protein ACM3WV_07800 [Bacillota bacterium]